MAPGKSAPPAVPPKAFPRPSSPYRKFNAALADFCAALGLFGLDGGHLLPYQREVYQDLLGGPDEVAVAVLHEWWRYDIQALVERGGGIAPPAKPRIALTVAITSKGNLALTWQPDPANKNDWKHEPSDYTPTYSRPADELLFVRGFGGLSPQQDLSHKKHSAVIDQHLLALGAALIKSLRDRLKHSFDIRMVTELALQWDVDFTKTSDFLEAQAVLEWTIENVAERERLAEIAELDRMLKSVGRDALGFVILLAETHPGLTLSALSDRRILSKMRLASLKRSINLTPAPLSRLVTLIRKHRPMALRPIVPSSAREGP